MAELNAAAATMRRSSSARCAAAIPAAVCIIQDNTGVKLWLQHSIKQLRLEVGILGEVHVCAAQARADRRGGSRAEAEDHQVVVGQPPPH